MDNLLEMRARNYITKEELLIVVQEMNGEYLVFGEDRKAFSNLVEALSRASYEAHVWITHEAKLQQWRWALVALRGVWLLLSGKRRKDASPTSVPYASTVWK